MHAMRIALLNRVGRVESARFERRLGKLSIEGLASSLVCRLQRRPHWNKSMHL
jgi:hypothetical protein